MVAGFAFQRECPLEIASSPANNPFRAMKATLVIFVSVLSAWFLTGCESHITRTGYQLPAGQTSKSLPKCTIAIQRNAKFDTNAVTILGSVHAGDTGFSTDCDEAVVLDTFAREACMLGADLINITEEKQPSFWTSTCYRASAQFLKFNDRKMAEGLLSDPHYAPELIVKRATHARHRQTDLIYTTVFGGPLAAIVVWNATAPKDKDK